MPAFFSTPSNILVQHEVTLIDYQAKKVKFNPDDMAHKNLVSECTQSVSDRLKALQQIDIKITIGFSLGSAALLASYFLPFWPIAIVGFAYGAYQMGRRKQAYVEYTSALENLAKCCIWTLGEVSAEEAHNKKIMNTPEITRMIDTLAPLTNTQQLRDFIDDKVEDDYIEEANAVKKEMTLFDKHLDEEKVDLYFKIYGYKQGGFLAVLSGIGYAIKNAAVTIKNACAAKIESYSAVPTNNP